MFRNLVIFVTVIFASACTEQTPVATAPNIDSLVREYLFLELSMGEHDKAHVDAYFGPDDIRADAVAEALSLDDILQQSKASVHSLPRSTAATMTSLRIALPASSRDLQRCKHASPSTRASS